MIRRPPRSTLFPTRRSSDLEARLQGSVLSLRSDDALLQSGTDRGAEAADLHRGGQPLHVPDRRRSRSEEHTSELQSRLHLVCRLLLEKKKNQKHTACTTRAS